MELIKRNIHMDRVKRSTVMQFTMEEDLNLPEDKPDISTLNLEKGEIVIEEIRPGMDEVTVRGKLGYAILYHTQEAGSSLILLSGALPLRRRSIWREPCLRTRWQWMEQWRISLLI